MFSRRTILLLAIFSLAYAYEHGSSIASCGDFNCYHDEEQIDCEVGGVPFERAGSVPISVPDDLPGLSWSIGQTDSNYTDRGTGNKEIRKSLLIGYPNNVDFSTLGRLGCAVFFTDSIAHFKPPVTTQGCSSVLPPACISTLRDTAAFALLNAGSDCSVLEDTFSNKTVPIECGRALSATDRFTGIQVRGFTGNSPPMPTYATCAPVVPRGYYLAPMVYFSSNSTQPGYDNFSTQAIPILTAFSPDANGTTVHDQKDPFADLTCLYAPQFSTGVHFSVPSMTLTAFAMVFAVMAWELLGCR